MPSCIDVRPARASPVTSTCRIAWMCALHVHRPHRAHAVLHGCAPCTCIACTVHMPSSMHVCPVRASPALCTCRLPCMRALYAHRPRRAYAILHACVPCMRIARTMHMPYCMHERPARASPTPCMPSCMHVPVPCLPASWPSKPVHAPVQRLLPCAVQRLRDGGGAPARLCARRRTAGGRGASARARRRVVLEGIHHALHTTHLARHVLRPRSPPGASPAAPAACTTVAPQHVPSRLRGTERVGEFGRGRGTGGRLECERLGLNARGRRSKKPPTDPPSPLSPPPPPQSSRTCRPGSGRTFLLVRPLLPCWLNVQRRWPGLEALIRCGAAGWAWSMRAVSRRGRAAMRSLDGCLPPTCSLPDLGRQLTPSGCVGHVVGCGVPVG
eukprot:191614-Chlamydomonas_euryale.AAC.7